ncbi:hypothetical protein SAMN05421810_105284 [Amycolatopsis arida]|uniref:Excreted virulence factor EspC, type VII ESX diderm n=1 Tax=Amycolatopsis arida TaxID=587909 RepID=A0A1I5WV35_9PSEU|nr:hypothetical protein [Amycolatopsis arida]TDX92458.1 hypothetical protein CLV69_105303 [Amycolatopsis arida]SFQ23377.1 hypothetical protein SAMN05421810_105284 [Amycolatopsis arida]
MSNGYAVNVAELARLITTLEDGANEVREANKTLAAQGQLDLLGDDVLKNAAHEFEEKWRYGLEKLDEAAKGVIKRLESAKKNYEALEEEYAGAIDKIIPAGTGSPPGIGSSPPLVTDGNRPPGMPGGPDSTLPGSAPEVPDRSIGDVLGGAR